jgi:hypothetical protein
MEAGWLTLRCGSPVALAFAVAFLAVGLRNFRRRVLS